MKITIYECDKCKKQTNNEEEIVKAFGMVDLCSDCFAKATDNFMKWLEGAESPSPKPPTRSKHQTMRKSEIDWDKVCALKLAGWKNWRIADEMGVSEKTLDSGTFYSKFKKYKLERNII